MMKTVFFIIQRALSPVCCVCVCGVSCVLRWMMMMTAGRLEPERESILVLGAGSWGKSEDRRKRSDYMNRI